MRFLSERVADRQLWVEAFVLSNITFLALDIYLAHSTNGFRERAEYLPLYFSLAAPILLAIGLAAWWNRWMAVWRDVGHLVGWASIALGIAGLVLHLDSRFFADRTLKSLTYAAPFAAPLAYTGLGLLLVMNRMVAAQSRDWAKWVLFFALGGFAGNFLFSVTDHAVNGFFARTEWLPVVASALAIGFLLVPFLMQVGSRYLALCGFVLSLQAVIGALGFFLHGLADWHGPSARLLDNVINGAPPFAPLLLPNLALLGAIALWSLHRPGEPV